MSSKINDIATYGAPVLVRVTVEFSDGNSRTISGINASNTPENNAASVDPTSATIDTVSNASNVKPALYLRQLIIDGVQFQTYGESTRLGWEEYQPSSN